MGIFIFSFIDTTQVCVCVCFEISATFLGLVKIKSKLLAPRDSRLYYHSLFSCNSRVRHSGAGWLGSTQPSGDAFLLFSRGSWAALESRERGKSGRFQIRAWTVTPSSCFSPVVAAPTAKEAGSAAASLVAILVPHSDSFHVDRLSGWLGTCHSVLAT